MVQREFEHPSHGNSGSWIEKIIFLIPVVLPGGTKGNAGKIARRTGPTGPGLPAWIIAELIYILCMSGL